jgi:hypothetical protein
MMVSAKQLVGRKIVAFDPGSWVDADGVTKHTPKITLDDGSVLHFRAEELDDGSDYGIYIGRTTK